MRTRAAAEGGQKARDGDAVLEEGRGTRPPSPPTPHSEIRPHTPSAADLSINPTFNSETSPVVPCFFFLLPLMPVPVYCLWLVWFYSSPEQLVRGCY